ncbi:MAG: DUF4920 domain-containing protein [Acidobacteria bacterium]|nr:DUF4920 domain-containing protein [Acidobacteriota bacterium]
MKLLIAGVFAVSMAQAAHLGKPFTLAAPVSVEEVAANPAKYTGKVVQVKGKVTEVCQMMGCWMSLTGGGKMIRVKVNDGEIEFPKTSPGKTAVAEGVLTRIELSREQAVARARHEAEEQGRKFNPSSVKSGAVIYQIQGVGAEILD